MSGDEDSDDALVRLVATGDGAAFARLVARHRSRLMALTIRSLGDRAAAEDVVQDVFTRAWIKAPLWQSRQAGQASYRAWLSRVAVNLVVDRVRRERSVPLDAAPDAADEALLPDDALVAREREICVRRAVAALPERQRTAIGLTYDAELSNAEGAAAMGTSIGAFELLLVRARRQLRQSLSDERRLLEGSKP